MGTLNLERDTKVVLETYLSNYRLVAALAAKYGFDFGFFFQPNIRAGAKRLTVEEEQIAASGASDPSSPLVLAVHALAVGEKSLERLYYMGNLFDSRDDSIWIDPVHVTPDGNRLVAATIARHITADNRR